MKMHIPYIDKYLNSVPFLGKIIECRIISNAWEIEKYDIQADKHYLLLTTDSRQSGYIQQLVGKLDKLQKNGITTNRVADYRTEKSGRVFLLLSWIEGSEISELLSSADLKKKRAMGIAAGKLLNQIHHIGISEISLTSVKTRISFILKNYKHSNADISVYSDFFYNFVSKQFDIINNQNKIVFLHGDYQAANLIYTKDNRLVPIDWVADSYGYPHEDFVRIHISAETSRTFASSQIQGYFDSHIPADFWEKLRFFTALHQIEILNWQGISSDHVHFVREQHQRVMLFYNGMKEMIPNWFREER